MVIELSISFHIPLGNGKNLYIFHVIMFEVMRVFVILLHTLEGAILHVIIFLPLCLFAIIVCI